MYLMTPRVVKNLILYQNIKFYGPSQLINVLDDSKSGEKFNFVAKYKVLWTLVIFF